MKIATLDDVREAQEKIATVVRKTECRYSKSCSERAGLEVFLKFENLQKTGSFKIRGATNRITNLTDEERKRGVICSSAGNHAQGVAYAANRLQIPATIVMPVSAPLVKVQATKGYGATVIQYGAIFDEAFEYAKKLAQEKNLVLIPPFADPSIIAGQGTIGLELLEQLQEIDSIVVPVGGGGL
ncbi:MAG: pyridoxal-phosphate dependent enzyme, partial [Bdellovibrionales bacterium]|nr:pyridoxal-phosphate dependent enzyme [Bdellovibrionales bacterium]